MIFQKVDETFIPIIYHSLNYDQYFCIVNISSMTSLSTSLYD